ncbi:MAG: hypothetical protein WC552_07100 [Candidatus Omnitrophota bacterium]
MNRKPTVRDVGLLFVFTIFITFQPYFLHDEIIMMETGIHLPAINALFHGAVPYRDFFYLRGPFELYVPAFLMLIFGKGMAVLPFFYYAGTVVTLLVGILIGQQLYRTRFVFYLMVPVLIARTFPRVSYNYWGGMRYALGLLSLWLAILFFKRNKFSLIFLAGMISALALLTTVESGACSILAIIITLAFLFFSRLRDTASTIRSFSFYLSGLFLILIPYVVYLSLTRSFFPFIETQYTVLTQMTKTFVDVSGYQLNGAGDFARALLPTGAHFKYMTPVFFYLIFFAYLGYRLKTRDSARGLPSLLCLVVYGLILYAAAFRKIEGHHFEMALQTEKILLFFLAEELYFFLRENGAKSCLGMFPGQVKACGRLKTPLAYIFIFVFAATSLGYSIARYNRRFPMFQLLKRPFSRERRDFSPLAGIDSRELCLERGRGLIVPRWQAEELEQVTGFLKDNTSPDEFVFTYPELGDINFLADRPFIGRFPIATFAWLRESWTEELLNDLKRIRPRFVVMTNIGHRTFPEEWYFKNEGNRRYFYQFTDYILQNYKLESAFYSCSIYRLK